MLHRYVTRELLTVTGIALVVFVAILVAGNALREPLDFLAEGKIGWSTFGFLLAILVPAVAPLALPLALLFATLFVFGRLSASGEITAMRASGISLYRIVAPVFFLAVIGTLVSMLSQFYYEPMAKTELRRTLASVVQTEPERFIRPREFVFDFPGFAIYFDHRDEFDLVGFHAWELDESGAVLRSVAARRATISFDETAEVLLLDVRDGVVELRGNNDPDNPRRASVPFTVESWRLRLPLADLLGDHTQKIDYLTLDELVARWRDTQGSALEGEHMALQTFIQKRFSFSFAVLSLATLAVPLGIRVGRTEASANFGMAVGSALLYFTLAVGVSFAEDSPGLRPDLLLWLPNLLFQSCGLFLVTRIAEPAH